MAVALAVALFPLLLADLLVIFHAPDFDSAVTEELVHFEEPFPYVNVPVTFTYHNIVPLEFL